MDRRGEDSLLNTHRHVRAWAVKVLASLIALAACGHNGNDASDPDAGTDPSSISLSIVPYAGTNKGVYFSVPISIDGSPPVNVLVDTASSGLRVFASALDDPSLVVTAEPAMFFRDNGDTMIGHTATGTFRIGSLVINEPINFQLVESFSCQPTAPDCDLASGSATAYTDSGIFGILGVSLDQGFMSNTYSPLAELADGFTFHTSGFGSTTATLQLGPITNPPSLALNKSATLPNGKTAWQMARLFCFKIDGTPTDPACVGTVLDSGSADDFVVSNNVPAAKISNGALAPGVAWSEIGGGDGLGYTVTTQTSGQDRLVVDGSRGNAFGIEAFLRFDIGFDITNGAIVVQPR
jgi:hypothetical protein